MVEKTVFSVTITDQPLEERIRAGQYYYCDENITPEHFPIAESGTRTLEVVLVHFKRGMTEDEVLQELEEMGLQAGRIEHLLAFGATYPEEQRKYPIICFGSVWEEPDGGRRIPLLDANMWDRFVHLWQLGPGNFVHFARYLAIPKE